MLQFSICLPVRNGFPYIRECVESILHQTYPHLELYVLDNNSTDDTLPWLTSLNDPRLRIWHSPTSLSIVDSWKRIKDINKQEFMTLIGHDDVLDPDFLATIKELIIHYPHAGLYSTGGRLINAEGKIIRSCKPIAQQETAADYLHKRFIFERDVFGTGYVMRSSDYDSLGGIPPFERLFFADDALWLSLMQGKIKASDPSEHFSVRIHPASESASLPSSWHSILTGLRQFSTFLQEYRKNDLELSSMIETYSQGFMLTYHRNAYIFALIEAAENNERITQETVECIQTSLRECAPNLNHKLTRSFKITALDALSASPLRFLIPWLWKTYFRFRNITQ